jgi:hypothetical protein
VYRCRTITTIVAVFLAVLILLPFSAPFKTFDLSDTHSGGGSGNLPNEKLDCDDDLVNLSGGSLVPPDFAIVVVAPFTHSRPLDTHPRSYSVLRL